MEIVTEETSHELFKWKYDILISICVSVTSLKIVRPRGMILAMFTLYQIDYGRYISQMTYQPKSVGKMADF